MACAALVGSAQGVCAARCARETHETAVGIGRAGVAAKSGRAVAKAARAVVPASRSGGGPTLLIKAHRRAGGGPFSSGRADPHE